MQRCELKQYTLLCYIRLCSLTTCWASLRVCSGILADLFFLTLFVICSKCACVKDALAWHKLLWWICHFGYHKWCPLQQLTQLEWNRMGCRGENTRSEHGGEKWKSRNERTSLLPPLHWALLFLETKQLHGKIVEHAEQSWLVGSRFVSQLSLLAALPASNEVRGGGGALICFSSSLRKRPPGCLFSIPLVWL